MEQDLTSVWVTSPNVSGDADDCQGVDAGEAKQQGEETVHLEGDTKKRLVVRHKITP